MKEGMRTSVEAILLVSINYLHKYYIFSLISLFIFIYLFIFGLLLSIPLYEIIFLFVWTFNKSPVH